VFDDAVLGLNEHALEQLSVAEKQLSVVSGGTHLYEEREALEEIAGLGQTDSCNISKRGGL
jgi:hypothetical protein